MALKKEIKDQKGIITGYHKIAKFIVDSENKLVQVLVRHYSEAQYRELEKENQKENNNLKEKYKKLNKLVEENLPETVPERIELTNYINAIQEVKDNEPMFVVSDSQELLPFDSNADYSLNGVYGELKKLDKYKYSEDI